MAGFVLFVLAYNIVEFRDVLELTRTAAAVFASFVALVSLWLFAWGLGFRLAK